MSIFAKNTLKRCALTVWLFCVHVSALHSAEQNCARTALYGFETINDWYNGISSTLGSDFDVGAHINDEFFRVTPQGVESGVILDIKIDPETQTATLSIDPNCKWSNGEPITAQDIKAGIETAFHPLASPFLPVDGMIVNAQAVKEGKMPMSALNIQTPDAQTVQFQTEVGSNNLKLKFSDAFISPIPSKMLAGDPDYAFSKNPPETFSGPYMITQFDPKIPEIKLKANPYFCGLKPKVSDVVLQGKSTISTFISLASQADDLTLYVPGTPLVAPNEIMAIELVEDQYTTAYTSPTHVAFYRYNAVSGPLKDKALRRLLTSALDWTGSTGIYQRIIGQTNQSIPAMSLLPSNYVHDLPAYPRDVRSRENRIAQARNDLEARGYSDENPLKLTAALAAYQKYYFYPMKEMVEADLPIKITETIFEDTGQYYETVFTSDVTDFDISLAEWGSQTPSSLFYLDFYFHNNITPASLTQKGQPLLDSISSSSDDEEVTNAEHAAIELLFEEEIFVPVFVSGELFLISQDVQRRNLVNYPLIADLEFIDGRPCGS